jgi:hypothetical protein
MIWPDPMHNLIELLIGKYSEERYVHRQTALKVSLVSGTKPCSGRQSTDIQLLAQGADLERQT